MGLALAFPTPGWSSLAWVAPGGWWLVLLGGPRGQAFRLGYVGGLAYHLTALRWLLHIPFPAGAVAGWLALSAYLALYVGLWTWACSWLAPPIPVERRGRWGSTQAATSSPPSWREAALALTHASWLRCQAWVLFGAAAWVAGEELVAQVLTGFPWNPLGASQYAQTPLIQLAAVTGVPGVSFLVAWCSLALTVGGVRWCMQVATRPVLGPIGPLGPVRSFGPFGGTSPATDALPRQGPRLRLAMLADVGPSLLAVVLVTGWGVQRLTQAQAGDRELKVALIQPAIPQRLIWDPAEAANRFQQLLDLSRLALATRPDLVVWPEAALPPMDEAGYQTLSRFVAASGVWMVLGADDAVPRPEGGYDTYNAAVLLGPDGTWREVYRKQRLVVFGEYIPFERWLPFMKWLTPIEGSFRSGPGPVTFVLTNPPVRFSPLICFEDVFARGVRRHAQPDTDFLLNLTNDGWFGESAAHWQHAVHAAFRAVENGLPLVRCTNNGLTCWVDAQGRFRAILGRDGGNVYGPGLLTLSLPLPTRGTRRPPTPYQLGGHRFGAGCVLLTLAGLLGGWWCRSRVDNPQDVSPSREAGPASLR